MKILRMILCFILSVSTVLLCGGCKEEDSTLPLAQNQLLEYTFYGAWFAHDQQPHDSFSFSFSCNVPTGIQPDGLVHEATISIDFPDHFDYGDAKEQTVACYGLACGNDSCSVTYWFSGTSKHNKSYYPVTMNIFFCPQKEYLMIQYGNDADHYVLATTDSNIDPMEIYTHFSSFLDSQQTS